MTVAEIFERLIALDIYPLDRPDQLPSMCLSLSYARKKKVITKEQESQCLDEIEAYMEGLQQATYQQYSYLIAQLRASYRLPELPSLAVMTAVYGDWDNRPTNIARMQELVGKCGGYSQVRVE